VSCRHGPKNSVDRHKLGTQGEQIGICLSVAQPVGFPSCPTVEIIRVSQAERLKDTALGHGAVAALPDHGFRLSAQCREIGHLPRYVRQVFARDNVHSFAQLLSVWSAMSSGARICSIEKPSSRARRVKIKRLTCAE
jgi:hypothetical protein